MEFELPKSFDDVEPPVILDAREYRLMLIDKKIEPNKNEDGHNLVIQLQVTGEPNPKANGCEFTVYCALPKPGDENKKTKANQTFVDFKMTQLRKAVEALGGQIQGKKFIIPDMATCRYFINKKTREDGSPYNLLEGDMKPDPAGARAKAIKKS